MNGGHIMTSNGTSASEHSLSPDPADHGFTVVEFVVASAILLGVVVSIMSVIFFASRATASAAVRDSATNLANQRMEQARNLPYDDVGVYYDNGAFGDPPGTILTPETVNEFQVDTRVWWERDPGTGRATYKNITVTVSWTQPRDGSLSISSAMYGKSSLTNTGDVSITVLDIETAEPIEGAAVIVSPSSGNSRSLFANPDGEAFFGFVPSGDMDVEVQYEDYIFDMAAVEGAQVAPDALTRLTVFGQRPSSAVIHVTGSGGGDIGGAQVTISNAAGDEFTDTTNASGLVRFDGLLIGEWIVEATAAGRSDVTDTFAISTSGETVEYEIVMPDPAALMVRVLTDGSNSAIQGAQVSVTGPQPQSTHAPGSPGTTNPNGEVSYEITRRGTYTVTVTAPGFVTATRTVLVDPGSTQTIEVTLSAPESGNLLVRVRDNRNRPIDRARVGVWSEDGTYSNMNLRCNDGEVLISDLLPGIYHARVIPSGQTGSATVIDGDTAILTLVVR